MISQQAASTEWVRRCDCSWNGPLVVGGKILLLVWLCGTMILASDSALPVVSTTTTTTTTTTTSRVVADEDQRSAVVSDYLAAPENSRVAQTKQHRGVVVHPKQRHGPSVKTRMLKKRTSPSPKVLDDLNSLLLVSYAGDSRYVKSRDFLILEDLLVDTYNHLTKAGRDPKRRVIQDIQVIVYDAGNSTNFTQFALLYTVKGTCLDCYEAEGNSTTRLLARLWNNISTTTSNSMKTPSLRRRLRPPTHAEMLQAYAKEITRAVVSGRLTNGGVLSVLDLQEVKKMPCLLSQNDLSLVGDTTGVGREFPSTMVMTGYIAISLEADPQSTTWQEVSALERAVQNAYNNLTWNSCDRTKRRITSVAFQGGSTMFGSNTRHRVLQEQASALNFNEFVFQTTTSIICTTCFLGGSLFSSDPNGSSRREDLEEDEEEEKRRLSSSTTFGSFGKDYNVEPLRVASTNASICTCPIDGITRAPTRAEFKVSLANEIARIQRGGAGELIQVGAVGTVTDIKSYCDILPDLVQHEEPIQVNIEFNRSTNRVLTLSNLERAVLEKSIQRSYSNLNFAACDLPYFRRFKAVNCSSVEVVADEAQQRRRILPCTAQIIYWQEPVYGSCLGCNSRKPSLFGNFGNRKLRYQFQQQQQQQQQQQLYRDLQPLTMPLCYCPVASSESPTRSITKGDFLSALQDTVAFLQDKQQIFKDFEMIDLVM